jgi:hypothetical protein
LFNLQSDALKQNLGLYARVLQAAARMMAIAASSGKRHQGHARPVKSAVPSVMGRIKRVVATNTAWSCLSFSDYGFAFSAGSR